MPDQPLRAFSPPSGPFFDHLHLSGAVSSTLIIQWTLFAVSVCWIIYTIVAIYHWIKYAHASWIAVPAIALHFLVSFILMGYAISGTLTL